ncbi:MAG: DUF1540 domain-containing protein [Bacilli bacterium]
MKKDKQNINCDVHSCKHCNCDENHCDLREVEIKNQSGMAMNEKETICSSYELDEEKTEE